MLYILHVIVQSIYRCLIDVHRNQHGGSGGRKKIFAVGMGQLDLIQNLTSNRYLESAWQPEIRKYLQCTYIVVLDQNRLDPASNHRYRLQHATLYNIGTETT